MYSIDQNKLSKEQYDVIVVGGGNAALVSAISAAESGATVLVLEKAPRDLRGGNSKFTRNFRFAHPIDWGRTSGEYKEEEFLSDIISVTHGKADKELTEDMVKHSIEAVKWADSHGIKWRKALNATLQLSRTNQFFLGGGKALLNQYYRRLELIKSARILYETPVQKLLTEHGRIIGVVVGEGDTAVNIYAGSVILASGGYESNLKKLDEYWGHKSKNFIVRGTSYNSGEVLFEALRIGAEKIGAEADGHMVACDARSPKFEGGIVTRVDSVIFGITINKNCERFFDEGEDIWPKRYAVVGKLVSDQPDQIAFTIFDNKSWGMFIPPAYPPYKADTIEELAKQVSLDPARMVKTICEFNDSVKYGCNFDPTRHDGCHTVGLRPEKTNWASKIDTPPFYCYPVRPGITFTYLGVKVNKKSEVIATSGGKIGGLYAAGEIMAGNILSDGYLGGVGMTIGTLFGIRAGREAAK